MFAASPAVTAYERGDAAASVAVHAEKVAAMAAASASVGASAPPEGALAPAAGATASGAKEDHGSSATDYIKSVVFGGLDGIITTFAIVASVQGAQQGLNVVLITGVAKLLGDGLAMGLGDAISEGAEISHIRQERKREAWEYANHAEGEVREMVEIYKTKGFTEEEARTVIRTMTKKPEYADYFVDHMVLQELGLVVPDADANPWCDGLVTFVSFMFFGIIPLLPYTAFYSLNYTSPGGTIGICAAVTVVTLFALGALQAYIIRQNILVQGLLMAFNGGVAAAAAYGIGRGLQLAFGIQSACE